MKADLMVDAMVATRVDGKAELKDALRVEKMASIMVAKMVVYLVVKTVALKAAETVEPMVDKMVYRKAVMMGSLDWMMADVMVFEKVAYSAGTRVHLLVVKRVAWMAVMTVVLKAD